MEKDDMIGSLMEPNNKTLSKERIKNLVRNYIITCEYIFQRLKSNKPFSIYDDLSGAPKLGYQPLMGKINDYDENNFKCEPRFMKDDVGQRLLSNFTNGSSNFKLSGNAGETLTGAANMQQYILGKILEKSDNAFFAITFIQTLKGSRVKTHNKYQEDYLNSIINPEKNFLVNLFTMMSDNNEDKRTVLQQFLNPEITTFGTVISFVQNDISLSAKFNTYCDESGYQRMDDNIDEIYESMTIGVKGNPEFPDEINKTLDKSEIPFLILDLKW